MPAAEEKKKILLAPLDPVHDIGLKMIRNELSQFGHEAILLPPDYSPQEIIKIASDDRFDFIMISRTLGYGVAEILGEFIDLADAAGIREETAIVIGGMAIRPELAAEIGFDAGFGPGTDPAQVRAYVENKSYVAVEQKAQKKKKDLTESSSYKYRNEHIASLLDEIVDGILTWSHGKKSPGIERSKLRREYIQSQKYPENSDRSQNFSAEKKEYFDHCSKSAHDFYKSGVLPSKTRSLSSTEQDALDEMVKKFEDKGSCKTIQHHEKQPKVFVQYGTGCPFMDVMHIKLSESWGADGMLHFDPSWGARTEGLLEGMIAHQEDGSVITYENLKTIRRMTEESTLWSVRAHRGLNTPETVVLAGETGADLTKINIVYGSLGAGTDPERLTVDGIESIRLAADYKLPFDIPTNEELCGVPAYKAFAGMLIVAHLGIRLGAKPLLKPLFCYSPEVMINGQMNENYVDYNAAKVLALSRISDIPIWPGEPIGFLTHSEDRVQSSVTTSLHASLASSLRVPAISIASFDEAYSGGPITSAARIDTLRAVEEAFRFYGDSTIAFSDKANSWADEIEKNIIKVLQKVARADSFVDAMYDGILGSKEDGAYPGRTGRNTVIKS